MCNQSPYEARSEQELQKIVVNDARNRRQALDELFRRCSELVARKAEYLEVNRGQLTSRCVDIACQRCATLQDRRFEPWLNDILDEVAFELQILSWLEDDGRKTLLALKKKLGLTSHDCEDLKQETFRKAKAKWKTFDSAKRPLFVWLRRIGTNAGIDLVRKRSRSPSPISGDVKDPREPHEIRVDNEDRLSFLRDRHKCLVKQLFPVEQEILERRFCGEETFHAIGSAYGFDHNWAYRALTSILTKLRALAEHEES